MGALGDAARACTIKYYATVNLGGFVRVVDTLGGVNVDVARGVLRPDLRRVRLRQRVLDHRRAPSPQRQPGPGLRPGPQGRRARATSPGPPASRRSSRASATRSSTAASSTTRSGSSSRSARPSTTNVPRELLPDLADLASQVGREQTYRAVVTHPLVGSGYDSRGSIQIPDLKAIRKLAAKLFPTDGSLPDDEVRPEGVDRHREGQRRRQLRGCRRRPSPRRSRRRSRPRSRRRSPPRSRRHTRRDALS